MATLNESHEQINAMSFTVADSDWRIGFINLLAKLLYLSKETHVLVVHDIQSNS